MRCLFDHIKHQIIEVYKDFAGQNLLPQDLDLSKLTVEPPKDLSHGEVSTNIAMILSKAAGKNPRELAGMFQEKMQSWDIIKQCDIAGPGFINLFLKDDFWLDRLSDILKAGPSYGDLPANKQKLNIEYVSANPTGPMHIGHTRGAVLGDVLANLLAKTGYDVCREYYINDAGGQVLTLARSLYHRYLEALGQKVGALPDGYYPGEYLVTLAQKMAAEKGDQYVNKPESEWLDIFRQTAIDAMMILIRADLKELGVHHDVFTSEKALHHSGAVDKAVQVLKDKDLIYMGVLEQPKGKVIEDWEERPQMLFKSTLFGDDVDRPLQKSDGSWTYFAPDIAYHYDKYLRGFKHMINIFGADHFGYKRLKSATAALSDNQVDLDVQICQLVNLLENGQPLKMSKRSGNVVLMRDMIDMVGKDAIRFMMLTRKSDSTLDFDVAKVLEKSKENPVFYVQYAHARISSVFRHAVEMFKLDEINDTALAKADLTLLSSAPEQVLIRKLATWPRLLDSAAQLHEPHRLAFYLTELAADFHAYWNAGKENTQLRFLLIEHKNISLARLALIRAVAMIMTSGLSLIGITPALEMTE